MAVEPTPTDSNLIENADDAIELMRAVGAPNVKLMFDTIHVLYRNEVPTDYVYRMGKDRTTSTFWSSTVCRRGKDALTSWAWWTRSRRPATTATCQWRLASTGGTSRPTW